MEKFILDSNFFIQASRSTYPLDVAISFWQKVQQLANAGTIISIDKVRDEIYRNEDELTQWCKDNLPDEFFLDSDEVIDEYTLVVQWAASRGEHFKQSAIDEFLSYELADAWLVANCLAKRETHSIVTYETSDPKSKRRIKIPDVCIAFDVQYTNTMGMFRALGERF